MASNNIASKLREHYHTLCRKEAAARQTYDAVFEGGNAEGEDEKLTAWLIAHALREELFDIIIQIGLYNEVFPSDDDDG